MIRHELEGLSEVTSDSTVQGNNAGGVGKPL